MMTMTQKILARHAGKETVHPGELIEARIDLALGNDVTAPPAIEEFCKYGFRQVFDAEKIALVLDHFTPNKDIASAKLSACVRNFAREQGITHFYDVGRAGIEHALLPEQGLCAPGELIIGADSHTCTYGALGAFSTGVGSTDLAAAMAKGVCWFRVPEAIEITLRGELSRWVSGKDVALYIIGQLGVDGARYASLEFAGDGVSALSMADRFCIANMAIEAGAKNAIFPVDEKTQAYLAPRVSRAFHAVCADRDAQYAARYSFDLSEIPLTVAAPHLPENAKPVAALRGLAIDQVVIGSCTNGRIEDMRAAAEILRGRHAADSVRLIVIPATQEVVRQMLAEGIFEVFLQAGAAVSTPTCGPCLGGHMGILAPGERAVATTNRNFVGRMGDPTSEVYLASPAVAAACAVCGRIASPEEL